MPDITTQAANVFEDGKCQKTILFSCKNATAGDTLDVGAYLRVIKRAGMISATGSQVATVSNAGTVLTIPTGPSADGVWLLVVGVSM